MRRDYSEYFDRIVPVVLVATMALVGLFVRSVGIGEWSLASDEYHTSQSVRFILDHGVPRFDCGGFYMRGVGYQYLLAGAGLLFSSSSELIFRAVTVLSFPVLVAGIYLLGRQLKISGLITAAIAVISLSVIEIETARYIRSYAPFQAVFVFYMVFFVRAVLERSSRDLWVLYGLSIVGLLIHETGIFLVLLNLAGAYSVDRKKTVLGYAIPAALLLIAVLFVTYDFRFLGQSISIGTPAGDEAAGVLRKIGPLLVPDSMALKTHASAVDIGAYVLFGLFLIWHLVSFANRTGRAPALALAAIVASVLVALNQFGALFLLAVVGMLWSEKSTWWPARMEIVRFLAVLIVVGGFFWTGIFLSEHVIGVDDLSPASAVKNLVKAFVIYPDINRKILYEWWSGQPIATLWLSGFSAVCIGTTLMRLDDDRYRALRVLLAAVIVLCMLISAVSQPYYSIRYSFFLYPMLVLFALAGMKFVSEAIFSGSRIQNAAFAGLVLAMIGISDDFSVRHIQSISSLETNFRLNMEKSRQYHLWYRMDYKTPSLHVNANRGASDEVASTMLAPNYYLERLDVVIRAAGQQEVESIAGCDGDREIWSGADLLYTDNEIEQWLDDRKTAKWILARNERFPYQSDLEKQIGSRFGEYRVYTSVDGRVDVFRIPAGAPD